MSWREDFNKAFEEKNNRAANEESIVDLMIMLNYVITDIAENYLKWRLDVALLQKDNPPAFPELNSLDQKTRMGAAKSLIEELTEIVHPYDDKDAETVYMWMMRNLAAQTAYLDQALELTEEAINIVASKGLRAPKSTAPLVEEIQDYRNLYKKLPV